MNKRRNKSWLSKLADAAFKRVAVRVIERAKQTGTPVIVWEEGRIKAVPPGVLAAAIRAKARKESPTRKRASRHED